MYSRSLKLNFYSSYKQKRQKTIFQFFTFLSKKLVEMLRVTFAFKMAPSNLKIKESIIEFYKLHSKKGHDRAKLVRKGQT